MNVLIKILPHNLPVFVREEILAVLFEATADGFGCPTPANTNLAYEEHLRSYALFTREQAEKAIQSGRDLSHLKTNLYQNVYPLGRKLRRWFGIHTIGDVMILGQILYKAIGIEVEGTQQGNVMVKSCFFSQFYTAAVCDLISALDDGIFSGLSDGGRLKFSQRITKNGDYCRAHLLPREEAFV